MSENKDSRVNKFERKRKHTKLFSLISILGGLAVVILIAVIITGGKDSKAVNDTTEKPKVELNEKKPKDKAVAQKEDAKKEKDIEKAEEPEEPEIEEPEAETPAEEPVPEAETDVKTERVETSDPNVADAFTGNWEPIGTSQTGAHRTNYENGSQDRQEMEQAIQLATGIESMTVWWLERGSEQTVKATISNKQDKSEVYRVTLEWIDGAGWRPAQVELLKENDQKWRF